MHSDDWHDERGSNPSATPAIGDVIVERLSRRAVLVGLTAAATVPLLPADASAAPGSGSTTSSFRFHEVAAGVDDQLHVADDHNADVLIRWGDPVLADAPGFDALAQTAAAQARQFGYNNDFVGYIGLNGSSVRGLLVVNHEYTNRDLMFPGFGAQEHGKPGYARVTREIANIEMMGHGGSVIEIRRIRGKWRVWRDSPYSRRITAETEMAMAGPAAAHALLRTNTDPGGTRVKGTLSNCAGATTPWGTWLTCEENFHFYFWNREAAKKSQNVRALERYGVPVSLANWGQFHDRFDLAKEPNECNRFGWVVEIDPLDPRSMPVKRTALGRFKHEGAGNVVNRDGRFVVYSGDDERFEYIYKFVSKGRVNRRDRGANRNLLDDGTLYVARFDADGTGHWLPLVHGEGKLTAQNGFPDQATVLVHARLAADVLGATRMDRPEDIDVSPRTGKVYVMLTHNANRTAAQVDAANPRANNRFGHILELIPDRGDHAADKFKWDILVRCGDPRNPQAGATFNPATSSNGWFGMPDNGLVDAAGRLWVGTDGNNATETGRNDGLWAVETEGKARGTAKLFLRCPIGAELCGPAMTPDMTTLFVAVQHPGEGGGSTFERPSTRWPDFTAGMPPRPSVVAITRRGGGRVG